MDKEDGREEVSGGSRKWMLMGKEEINTYRKGERKRKKIWEKKKWKYKRNRAEKNR